MSKEFSFRPESTKWGPKPKSSELVASASGNEKRTWPEIAGELLNLSEQQIAEQFPKEALRYIWLMKFVKGMEALAQGQSNQSVPLRPERSWLTATNTAREAVLPHNDLKGYLSCLSEATRRRYVLEGQKFFRHSLGNERYHAPELVAQLKSTRVQTLELLASRKEHR